MDKISSSSSLTASDSNTVNLEISTNFSFEEEIASIEDFQEMSALLKSEQMHQSWVETLSSVSDLFGEFLGDFQQRVQARLRSKTPCEEKPKYTLEIDRRFRRSLRQEFEKLSSLNALLTENYAECVESFVSDLSGELDSLKGKSKLLRVVCLNEAYNTLVNASNEIGKIVRPLGINNRIICVSAFYEKILKGATELLQYAAEEDRFSHTCELLDIEDQVLQLMRTQVLSFQPPSSSDEDDTAECLQKMPLDELVNFINDFPCKRDKKQRKKKRHRDNFENKHLSHRKRVSHRDAEEDGEVEAFKFWLDRMTVPTQRLKPNVSESYIDSLRHKLKQINN